MLHPQSQNGISWLELHTNCLPVSEASGLPQSPPLPFASLTLKPNISYYISFALSSFSKKT